MAIEVLLRRTVESLGSVGQVVRVRPGYARNFLFPHGLAMLPTKENLRLVEKDKIVEAALEAERAKVRAELLGRLAGVSIAIGAKANLEGHLFGSVGPKQVSEALIAKGYAVDERHVRMEPVKAVGDSEVKIHLAPDAETSIRLAVYNETTGPEPAAPTPAPAVEEVPERAQGPAKAAGKAKKPAK